MTELISEILNSNYVPVSDIDTELEPPHVIIYLKNNSDENQKIIIEPLTEEQLVFENQNPSVVVNNNIAMFCLSPNAFCRGAINHVEIKGFSTYIENLSSFTMEIDGISKIINTRIPPPPIVEIPPHRVEPMPQY